MKSDLTAKIRADPLKERAWADWYQSLHTKLYYFAFRLTRGDSELARDLVQETFTRFIGYRAIERVANDRHALLFLMKTCRNLAIDENVRCKNLVVGLEGIEEPPAEPLPLPGIELEQMLATLEPEERRIIQWVRLGESISEIAGKLGIAYSAAGVRIFRITKKLRKTYVQE